MREHIDNSVGHFDIAGGDAERLGSFYGTVFGWRIEAAGPGYALVKTPPGTPSGAIVEAEEAGITMGVVVRDLDAALASAVAEGGSIAMPATENGWVRKGVLVDPAGNRVTVIQA